MPKMTKMTNGTPPSDMIRRLVFKAHNFKHDNGAIMNSNTPTQNIPVRGATYNLRTIYQLDLQDSPCLRVMVARPKNGFQCLTVALVKRPSSSTFNAWKQKIRTGSRLKAFRARCQNDRLHNLDFSCFLAPGIAPMDLRVGCSGDSSSA